MQLVMSDYTTYDSPARIISLLETINKQAGLIHKSVPVLINSGRHLRTNPAKSPQIIKRQEEIFWDLQSNLTALHAALFELNGIAEDLSGDGWSIVWSDNENPWADNFYVPEDVYSRAEGQFTQFQTSCIDLWDKCDDLLKYCCIRQGWENGRLVNLAYAFPNLPDEANGDPSGYRQETLAEIEYLCTGQIEAVKQVFGTLEEETKAALARYTREADSGTGT